MKKLNKIRLWWLICGICIGVTPYIFKLADIERGYNSTGSEVFIPLLPLIICGIWKQINIGIIAAQMNSPEIMKAGKKQQSQHEKALAQ